MKNLFRLSALAVLTGAFVSCSKSADNLTDSDNAPAGARMNMSRDASAAETWTKIYPGVAEPRITMLGNPDSYLYTDDQTVFYVIVSSDADSQESFSGTLTLTDDATGDPIQTYTMLSDKDPAAANLIVPEEILQGQLRFMFAVVTLDSQYTGKTVSLNSAIATDSPILPVPGSVSLAWLSAAFSVL
ncbi:MAG: hypothetical protein ACT4OJ_04420 [Bacteroidota bacterium]